MQNVRSIFWNVLDVTVDKVLRLASILQVFCHTLGVDSDVVGFVLVLFDTVDPNVYVAVHFLGRIFSE